MPFLEQDGSLKIGGTEENPGKQDMEVPHDGRGTVGLEALAVGLDAMERDAACVETGKRLWQEAVGRRN